MEGMRELQDGVKRSFGGGGGGGSGQKAEKRLAQAVMFTIQGMLFN